MNSVENAGPIEVSNNSIECLFDAKMASKNCLMTTQFQNLSSMNLWHHELSNLILIKKAFDKIPHQRLLIKLKSHEMRVNIVTWIQNWLTDRRQRVSVEGETSAWTAVHIGVPQGSVLGPLLFLIYINDLEDGVASNILKFADDTILFRIVQTRQECHTLQEDLNRLERWSAKWQMLFNQSKCKCLHIGRANGKVLYEMHNTFLLKISKEKDLGVTISADWKVSEQCGIAARKGNQLLGMIKRNITYRET